MIRQYRHPVGRELWELPAGLRDVAGEPPAQTARRELLEETGYLARDWHVLADYFSSPGIFTERLRVFLARGLEEVPEADRDFVPENEEAHLVWTGCRWTASSRWSWPVTCIMAFGCRVSWPPSTAAPNGFAGLRGRGRAGRPVSPATEPGVGKEQHDCWRPAGGQEPRVPGGHHPGGRARAGPPRPRGGDRAGRRRRLIHPRRGLRRGRRQSCPPPTTSGQTAELVLKVKEPVAEEYHRMRQDQVLFTYLHLAASRPCTDALLSPGSPRSPTRPSSCPTARCRCWRRCRGRGPDGPAGRRAPPAARRRWPRRADGRRVRRVRGQGGGDRRRACPA